MVDGQLAVRKVAELTLEGSSLTGKRQTEFGYDIIRAPLPKYDGAVTLADLSQLGVSPPEVLSLIAGVIGVSAGADVYVVQRMCGHASASTTLKHYGHLWDEGLDEAAEAIERHLET